MKFFIYSRKSVYTGKGDSIESQVELCRQFILLKYPDTTPDELNIYEDEGFSGKNLNRPQFQQMYYDFSVMKPDFLVCYRLDRISRSIGDFATLFEYLNQRHIAFVCIKENFDTSTPMGKAMLYITSVFAQLERETIAERVRDNMHQLARTGRWLGGTPPLGFSAERTEARTSDGHTKVYGYLQAVPSEQEIVRVIFDQFLARQSVSSVQKYLERRKMHTRLNHNFSVNSIKDILKNPVYCTADEDSCAYFTSNCADICFHQADCSSSCGLIAYNKRNYTASNSQRQPVDNWIVAIGTHQGLVSGAHWVSVQRLLHNHHQDYNASSHRSNDYALLSGRIRCLQCGSRMLAKLRSNRAGQFDYICAKKLQMGASACNCQNLNGHQADTQIFAAILNFIEFPLLSTSARHRIEQTLIQSNADRLSRTLTRQIARCDHELEQLTMSLTQTELTATFIQCVNRKMEQIALTRASLKDAREKCILTDAEDAPPLHLCRQASDIQSLPIEAQRSFLGCIIDHVIWDGERLTLHLREA